MCWISTEERIQFVKINKNIDPEWWLDKGELMELPEVPSTEVEERVEADAETSVIPEEAIEP